MKKPLTELIQIDPSLATPVYRQIVQSVYRSIDSGALVKDDVLPSVNKIAETFSLARGSVFSAYNDLRAAGIIDSIPGKGYFVARTETGQNNRIFLFLDTFGAQNEALYNALLKHLPKTVTVDVFFHRHHAKTVATRLREQAGYYNTFVVMPDSSAATHNVLAKLDPKRTFLLNTGFAQYHARFSGVFQNFEQDLYGFLIQNQHRVARYHRLFLVMPESNGNSATLSGFNRFSKETGTATAVLHAIATVKKGDAFIVLDDEHLVDLATLVRTNNWKWGSDVGVVSYNEAPLKRVVGDGITTITTDVEAMGKTMAEMIITGRRAVIENPVILIDRNSF